MEIDNLSADDKNILHALPFYVATLIASADGNVDETEIKRAITAINLQTSKETYPALTSYYHEVHEDFEDKLKIIISNSPNKPHDRSMYLSKKIVDANVVLQKLDPFFVLKLHNSLRDLARQVAKASGGIFGYGSIGLEESKLLNLSFIDSPLSKG